MHDERRESDAYFGATVLSSRHTLTTNTTGPTNRLLTQASGFNHLGDVACGGGAVLVSDTVSNRVVVLNAIPAANGPTWNLVLGQTTLTGSAAGTSATTLSAPHGVWTDGTRVIVADTALR